MLKRSHRPFWLICILLNCAATVFLNVTRPVQAVAAGSGTITADAGAALKTYPVRAPFTANYQPDYTAASAEFTGSAERHGVNAVFLLNQSQYNAAHPADVPCSIVHPDCGEAEYNWGERIDPQIDFLKHSSRAPAVMVEIIFQTPDWLQSSPGNANSLPNNLVQYGNIAADIWHHFMLQAPDVSKVYFEVWNEPDGTSTFVSVASYISLYNAVASAIKAAAASFSAASIVGGCACATLNAGGLSYLQQWLSGVAAPGDVDFVSWHEYAEQHVGGGDAASLWSNTVSQYPSYLQSTVTSVRSDIQSALKKSVPLLVTEYNISTFNDFGINVNPQYETPFIGLMTNLSLSNTLDGIDYFTNGGPDTGQVSNGFYLLDDSNVIAPWAWVNYLYDRSVGMQYQGFTLVSSASSDANQFPVTVKFADGSLGLVITNGSTSAVSDTITLNNSGLANGGFTAHQYLVDATHAVAQQPDVTGTSAAGTITFTVTVPPASVNGFSIGPGSGTAVHLPAYQFHTFSDNFMGYGAAGSTSVAPPMNNHYSLDFSNWVSTGPDSSNTTQLRGAIATASSDGLTFADAGAGSSTNALKVFGSSTSYVRTGSYHADWTVPPKQRVAITFQADWANGGVLILDPDKGNGTGNPLGSSNRLVLQAGGGNLSLSANGTTLGSHAFTPIAKTLQSWRLLVDGSTAELDQYVSGTNSWQAVIGPAAHNLPQTPTGMEAGLIYLGMSTSGASYWANVTVAGPSASPAVTGVSPSSGPAAGGTTVTIRGSGFTGATGVKFGSSAATGLTVTADTQISATSPAGSGTVDVTVITPGGTSATDNADQFTYVAQPVVTGLTPGSGPSAGGTAVTISGSGFTAATGVKFGSSAATGLTVTSDTQISATSPAGSGTVDVTVITPGGTSATGNADRFTYVAPPVVTSLTPGSGPAAGGTAVTISGSSFTGATGVKFGSSAATGLTVTSNTQISATSPAGSGTVDVTVITPGGTSATGNADQFTYVTSAAPPGLPQSPSKTRNGAPPSIPRSAASGHSVSESMNSAPGTGAYQAASVIRAVPGFDARVIWRVMLDAVSRLIRFLLGDGLGLAAIPLVRSAHPR